jgi:hypothetical protein
MTEQSTSSLTTLENELGEIRKSFALSVLLLMATGNWVSGPHQLDSSIDTNNRTHLIRRKRREVNYLFNELGYSNARRAYQMKPPIFHKLCKLLEPRLQHEIDNPLYLKRVPNGPISPSVRISIALRYLAGEQPMDIALVDAINKEPTLAIHFPNSHATQLQLANEFKNKSQAGFSNCMGVIDGLLIWIHKPTKQDTILTKCGETKFFCGSKKNTV